MPSFDAFVQHCVNTYLIYVLNPNLLLLHFPALRMPLPFYISYIFPELITIFTLMCTLHEESGQNIF